MKNNYEYPNTLSFGNTYRQIREMRQVKEDFKREELKNELQLEEK